MIAKRALITGITGQDGSYLAEQLLNDGYVVAGFIRSSSTGNLGNVAHLSKEITFYRGSLDDERSIEAALYDFDPWEIYNLGAEAAPFDSFQRPIYTSNINALGPLRIFEACKRLYRRGNPVKIYQASTSEMFGSAPAPQNEKSTMIPNNPYGVSKLFAHQQARILREGEEGMFIVSGILFNHESPRRGMQYVTRKISVGVACIKNRVKESPLNELGQPIINKEWKLHLGNLQAKRDWGYAPEYVSAIRLMMRQEEPEDFVIATGENHTVGDFVEAAFKHVGLNWRDHVVIDHKFTRPLETPELRGDASRAKEILKWEPKVRFNDLVAIMVDSDLAKFS